MSVISVSNNGLSDSFYEKSQDKFPVFPFRGLLKRGFCGDNSLCLLRNIDNWNDWVINESMFDFLKQFTGQASFKEIINHIKTIYSDHQADVVDQCEKVLCSLIDNGICELRKSPSTNSLRVFDKLFEYPLDGLSIALTTRCNFSCPYCYVERTNPSDLNSEMYYELINQAVEEMGVIQLGLTGGEPLLIDDLVEKVSYAAERGCKTTLLSNGLLLTPNYLDELIGAGLNRLSVSFDTDSPEIFDFLTGVSGSYKTVLNNIAYARSKNMEVFIGVVLLKGVNDNKKNLVELVNRFKELKVENISYTMLFPFGGASHMSEFIVEPENVAKLATWFTKTTVSEENLQQHGTLNYLENIRETTYRDLLQRDVCDLGKGVLHILPDGRITPCPSFPEIGLGNIHKDKLETLWSSSKDLCKLRKYDPNANKECNSCKISSWCNGGCRARAYYDSGQLDSHDRWACAMYSEYRA